jgi:hypothetical protein
MQLRNLRFPFRSNGFDHELIKRRKHVDLIWSAVGQDFSASTFREFVATHSCEVQDGLDALAKAKDS